MLGIDGIYVKKALEIPDVFYARHQPKKMSPNR